jgi:hypothetical protein
VLDGLELGVQFVHQRYAVGDVQVHDLGVADAVQHLHQRADAVAVRRHHQSLAAADGGRQALVPARQHTGHRVFQAFGQGHLFRRQVAVAQVAALAARVVVGQHWRRRVVAAAPDQHLLVTELRRHVGLVQALQRTVVAFVQAPVVLHRHPGAVHLVQGVPQRPDRALEHRGVGHVELVAGFLQQAPGLLRLLHAGGCQRHIGPAGEAVLQVPGRFPVADQDKFVHGPNSIIRPPS